VLFVKIYDLAELGPNEWMKDLEGFGTSLGIYHENGWELSCGGKNYMPLLRRDAWSFLDCKEAWLGSFRASSTDHDVFRWI
jgi:hypothetical protein